MWCFRAKGTRQRKWGKDDMECQYRQRPNQGNEGAGDQTKCNLPRMAMDRKVGTREREKGEEEERREKLVMEENAPTDGEETDCGEQR